MRKTVLTFIFGHLFFLDATCQEANEKKNTAFQSKYQLRIERAKDPIVLDGELNESSWQTADVATDFWMKFPRDDQQAPRQTEMRATYDDKFLYVSAVCYDTSYYVVQTLKRDIRYFDGDGIAVVIDPVNKKTNGFFFGVSPMNVQAEDLLAASSNNLNFSWDNKWFSEVTRHEDRWIVEMAIPFKTLRFEANSGEWGINFIRNDLKANQYHAWTNIPVNFDGYDLGYTGLMVWDKAPDPVKTNISVIPFITGGINNNREEETPVTSTDLAGGLDAKIGVTSSLNLDLTVLPDFSQIEVDVQQTNLTRFSLNYPERRTFFLENADLFTGFGGGPNRPFFSRRIGLDENAQPIPILAGARLSGNLTQRMRVGIMNIQTRATDDTEAQNYTAIAVNQRVFGRSLVKGYFHNRQSFTDDGGTDKTNYGRNGGLGFDYSNISGSLTGTGLVSVSEKPGAGVSYSQHYTAGYNDRHWSLFADYISVPTDFYADMGFIPRLENYDALRDTVIRLGFEHIYSQGSYTIRPTNGGKINSHEISASNVVDWNPDWSLNERVTELGYELRFQNTSGVEIGVNNNDVRLLFSTAFIDATPLPPATYNFSQIGIAYKSDERKKLAFSAETAVGGFYNGEIKSYQAEIIYRVQPWGNFSLGFEQNELDFPEGYGNASISLFSQRSEINFSNSLFWITFFQYNTQRNNFNINSRLQWRYKPMSDFYLVYTDNYFADPFLMTKSKAIVFKLNYWFTL
ncbi:DUF5916 domain-containing protein [Imperialibacter roseus]|uniref:DUF5916 domain-containing protein n=1 Tax=Imperialibacter roseus TaxID=1324217 RepID=A0ABZ0IGX1_9BACT|nr:DUF5916 domain-containing protein [Imperialibacter roseus]WOK04278.1 DUF5916 domain-containing protein [Imperialibacter roseus]